MRLVLKSDLHYTFVVRKNGPMTVTKVESPDFDVLVSGACNDQFRVM
jgi:hypothetical protein